MKNFLVKLSGFYAIGVGAVMIILSIYKIITSQRLNYEISHDSTLLLAAITYIILLGFWPIFTGIGIILRKNWARYSLFVMSVFALFIGLSSLLFLIFVPQSVGEAQAKTSPSLFEVFILVINFIFFIVMPLVFLLFFNRKKVKALFKTKEPEQKKNSRPIGITIMAVMAFFSGVSFTIFLFAPGYAKASFTFFGDLFLSVKLERIYFLVIALLNFYIAFGLFKMKKAAWIMCIIFMLASIVVGVINTFVVHKTVFLTNLPRISDPYAQIPESLYKLSSIIIILVPMALLFYLISKGQLFLKAKDKDAADR